MRKIVLNRLLFIIALAGILLSQDKLEEIKKQNTSVVYYAPKKEHLAFTTFGFKSVMADWLWLQSSSYFMSQLGKNGDYQFLSGMYETCIAIDPLFKQAYRDAMTFMLSEEKHYENVEKLLLMGREHLQDDWEINYMLGVLYAFYLKDKEKSLDAFEKAWLMIPLDGGYESYKRNIQISIHSISKEFNKGFELVRYWLQKIDMKKDQKANEYVVDQVRYYFSEFLAEELNHIFALDASQREEALVSKRNEIFSLIKAYDLTELLDLKLDKIFSTEDAYGYEWLYDSSSKSFFSYGAGAFELKRKLVNFQYALMGYLAKYREPVDFDFRRTPHEEWYLHFKRKSSVQEYPSAEEVFALPALPKLNSPIRPKYDPKYGTFSMPIFMDVKESFKSK